MSDEPRSVIFGREADIYDAARPSYPEAAISHLLELVDARVGLEVGAGTGKATTAVAHPDLSLTCLEPSPEMAAILESKQLPGVEVVVSTFEDWSGEEGTIDLIFAAQAWHWVNQDTGYRHALELLRPGGALALMWNIPLDRYGLFEDVYAEHAPEILNERDRRIHKRDSTTWDEDMAAAGLGNVSRFTHHWQDSLSGAGVRTLYSTYSDHMMLPPDVRNRLLDGLESAVDERGGTVDIAYRTEVFSGRKN